MCQGTNLLDEALGLARQEMTALDGGSYELAAELASKRCELTGMAWNLYEPTRRDAYLERMTELASFQTRLTKKATVARDEIRGRLQRSRREKIRLHGYQQAVGQALLH